MSYPPVKLTAEVVRMAAGEGAHVPVGRLGDGTPVFAPVGRMAAVDGERRVLCHACGAPLAHIGAAHLVRHGLTSATYRERFGLSPRTSLTAPGTQRIKAVEGHARYDINAAVHTGLAAGRGHTVATAEVARQARVAALGYPDDLAGYLRNRYITRKQGVVTIARELGASHRTARRLLDEAAVPRRQPGWPHHS